MMLFIFLCLNKNILQCWRQLSKLQKLILYLLTSVVLISLYLWYIGTNRYLEDISETNSIKLPQQTVWPQDIIVRLIMILLLLPIVSNYLLMICFRTYIYQMV